jgi:hypothetical protein
MLKKLLFLLLPFAALAQDGYVSHSYIDDIPTGGWSVGDTITVKFEYITPANVATTTPDFIHFDIEWNNKLLEKVSHEFDPSTLFPSNTQNSWYQWTGYKFNKNTNIEEKDLDGQYSWWESGASSAGQNSYPSSADWTVGRAIIQASSTLPSSAPLMYVKFKIKDRGITNYANYNNVSKINFIRAEDIGDSSGLYDLDGADYKMSITVTNGVNAGTIKIALNTPAKADYATDFGFSLFKESQLNENGYPAQDEVPFISGTFDDNGEYTTTDLVIDENYWIHTHVLQDLVTADDGSTSFEPTWLDDVLTVTDVYLIFQEAIGAGNTPDGTAGTFEYQIQYEMGEITNSGNVDFDDSYQGLAFLAGNSDSQWFTSTKNGAFNLSGDTSTFGVPSNDYYFGLKHIFKVTEGATINIGHAFKGDPDFSHSFTPTAADAKTGNTQTARMSMTRNAMQAPIIANLDIASELIEGEVHVSINLAEEGVVGNQFDIIYDNTILTLKDVVFDSGNEMTNFSKHDEELSKVFVGSLDQTGATSIKTGTPYKLVFTPNQTIQNTAGLVTFRFTEGVKADGTKVKYNIQ